MNPQLITQHEFNKRIVNLLLRSGMTEFPKKAKDQQVLLKSAALTFEETAVMSEKEVNEKLIYWVENIARIEGIDHATLRRDLVDGGYLNRADDGSAYQISPTGPRAWQFEPSIDKIDVPQLLQTAQEEMARRKKAYLEKQQKR